MRSADATSAFGGGARPTVWGRAVYQSARWLPLSVSILAGLGCASPSTRPDGADARPWQRVERAEPHMGTEFRIIAWTDDGVRAEAALDAAFGRIAELEATLSDYRPDSEISRLSRVPVGVRTPVSDDVWNVLVVAQEVSERTDGAFDVTVGRLVALWRRSRRLGALPTARRLGDAMAAVGWRNLVLHPEDRSVELAQAGMKIDVGGVAKGYAAEVARDLLRSGGLTRTLVDAGGDLVLGDPPPGQDGWVIALAPVDDGPPREALRLANCAIATSGDRYRYVEIDGIRYAHIVDPRTGLGVTGSAVATVVARDGAVADAVASALYVLGTADAVECLAGQRFAGQRVHVALRRFDPDRDAPIEHASGGFLQFERVRPPAEPRPADRRLESPGPRVLP